MRILVVARYTSGAAREGGSSRFMRCLINALEKVGHEVIATSEPKKYNGFNFDLIIYSHVVSDMSSIQTRKIHISQGIISDEFFAPGADAYVSISEEIRDHHLKKGIDSFVIGQPIKIWDRKQPGDELRNILIIRNRPVENDPFFFLNEKYNVRASDINKPIEDQITWADLCITLGRGALESMAQGVPVLIADNRDYIGPCGDGYVTTENIKEIAKNNFSGRRFKFALTREWIEEELAKYNPNDSKFLYEYVKQNHEDRIIIQKYLDLAQKPERKFRISNFKLAIGIPCSFPFIPSSFFYSFALMEKPDYIFIHADNGPIHELRNNLVDSALKIGATHLIMMDVDQVYDPKTIPRLLSHRLPVVGALVHRRYPPFDSLMLRERVIDEKYNGYDSVDEWEEGSLVEVDATGAGCLMFDMSVFRKLSYPWFRNDKAPKGAPPIGEDIGFCQDLKAAGYRIFVDTSVPAGHLTTMVVNTATNRLYRSMKERQHKKNLEQALTGKKQD